MRVAQGLVGLAEFLEFFLGGLVARIFVRMKFDGQLAVGLLDFLVAGAAADAEDFVIIAFGHGSGCGGRRRFFGDNDRGRAQQTVAQFIAFADLLDDLAFGHVGGFLLRNGLVQCRVKRFAAGVHFFEAGFGEDAFELLLNHRDAGLQGGDPALRASAVCAAACAISKLSSTGSSFCSSAALADCAASMRSRAARFLKFSKSAVVRSRRSQFSSALAARVFSSSSCSGVSSAEGNSGRR